MKPKTFCLEKGKYAVVATYQNHNDATGEEDENTIKTFERARPKLYGEMATLALRAKEYFGLPDLKVRIPKITFSENANNGRFVKIDLVSVEDLHPIKISTEKIKREEEVLVGTNDPNPDSKKNILLAQVDLVENKITEYLSGDREAPKLPEVEAPKEEEGLFGRVKKTLRGRRG